jgi:F0F1-type ATP synthase assembly protein I
MIVPDDGSKEMLQELKKEIAALREEVTKGKNDDINNSPNARVLFL